MQISFVASRCEKINIGKVERIMTELAKWDLKIEDTGKVERLAGESIFKELKAHQRRRGEPSPP